MQQKLEIKNEVPVTPAVNTLATVKAERSNISLTALLDIEI